MLKPTFDNSPMLTMIHFLIISIFLLPLVTASGDEFWHDVDMMDQDLSDPDDDLSDSEDLLTHALVKPMPETTQHSTSPNKNENKTLKRIGPVIEKFSQKFVTLRTADIEKFYQKLIINDSQNLPLAIMEDKLDALGNGHEWIDIHTYEVHKYPKYWAKICVTFWDKPLVKGHRIACIVSRSYASNKKRILIIGRRRLYFDLLSCKCHTYINNCKKNLSTPEAFSIHKGEENEFFIFGENESQDKQFIKGFKDGITLPNPSDLELGKKPSAKNIPKSVTLIPREIERFNRAITINTSYPRNVSLEEINDKLMELEEVHEWPDLFKYDHENYSRYWAKVCVLFWGKQLDSSHQQACIILPCLGEHKIRKLFLQGRTQHFDILRCKCHSYKSNYRIPISSEDTFLIHQSSSNEFFVFEQRATPRCKFTLFIRDFKGGITLPDPDNFK